MEKETKSKMADKSTKNGKGSSEVLLTWKQKAAKGAAQVKSRLARRSTEENILLSQECAVPLPRTQMYIRVNSNFDLDDSGEILIPILQKRPVPKARLTYFDVEEMLVDGVAKTILVEKDKPVPLPRYSLYRDTDTNGVPAEKSRSIDEEDYDNAPLEDFSNVQFYSENGEVNNNDDQQSPGKIENTDQNYIENGHVQSSDNKVKNKMKNLFSKTKHKDKIV